MTKLMYKVAHTGDGEFDMETDSGENITGNCRELTIGLLDVDTLKTTDIVVLVPTIVGPDLFRAICTDAQFEALIFAED